MFGGLLKKRCSRDFKLAVLSTVCRETHACSINGSIMVEVNLAIFTRSPNRQIEITVNISAYMVCLECNKYYYNVANKINNFHRIGPLTIKSGACEIFPRLNLQYCDTNFLIFTL